MAARPAAFHGQRGGEPSPEQPERIRALHKGAAAAGCTFAEPGIPARARSQPSIRQSTLLSCAISIPAGNGSRAPGAEVIPNIHPANRSDSYPKSAVGQAGYHQADTACPIGAGTWEAAYWSAQTAVTAAACVAGGDRAAYALSRPPGHHAFADLAGGFCFFNNSAIAAERLRAQRLRPAILDVDVHHGNGTQGIFYDRDDVLTVSIHADPARFYPFFWGHAQERGAGRGTGCNLNLPLERGTGDDSYLETL